MDINAGNENTIIDFLEKNIIVQANKLEESEKKIKENYEYYCPKKYFVILNGINACKSMHSITELMLKHTYNGKILPSNIIFIYIYEPYIPEDESIIGEIKRIYFFLIKKNSF